MAAPALTRAAQTPTAQTPTAQTPTAQTPTAQTPTAPTRAQARTHPRRPGMAGHLTALAAGVVVAQIAYPLMTGDARAGLTVCTVGLFFGACLTHAPATRGVARTARWVAVAGGTGLLVEALGTRMGVPFGTYDHFAALGPPLLGVPLVIPLAWAMMAYPALLSAVLPDAPRTPQPGRPCGPAGDDAVPLVLYLWTYAGSVLADVAFFGRPLVGLTGGLAMGVPVLLLIRSFRCDLQ